MTMAGEDGMVREHVREEEGGHDGRGVWVREEGRLP